MTDYKSGNRPGRKIHIDGVDYLDECTTSATKYGNIQFKLPEESAFYYQSGWRCFLVGGENGYLRWIKIGHARITYTANGGHYWRDDEIILQEYQTAKRSKEEVYYIFYQASEAEALKQLAFWQFKFRPFRFLSKYKPLFLSVGSLAAAALWGKVHG